MLQGVVGASGGTRVSAGGTNRDSAREWDLTFGTERRGRADIGAGLGYYTG
jgi:hypothetical protein